jgi:hypothetical protein
MMSLRVGVVGCALSVGVVTGLGTAYGQSAPVLVKAPVEKIFVPLGFDTNDDVEVFFRGHFPNSCYKVGPSKATFDEAKKTITLEASAYYYKGVLCAQMLVPFDGSVKVGMVPEGEYSVVVDGDTQVTEGILNIKVAKTADPDDYLYAPVENISITNPTNESTELGVKVEGNYPFMFIGCMVLRDVKMSVSPGNVVVIQPIAELVDGPECLAQADNKKFSFTKALGFAPKKEEYLLHARSTSGSSINRVVDFRYKD